MTESPYPLASHRPRFQAMYISVSSSKTLVERFGALLGTPFLADRRKETLLG